ncbi:dynein heavy chain [Trypanosoma conorhini]|uniref:Dynein heavy chain n=1 Tax=Trypanosoma conorhini TaxID=83891 RepID=A0A3R7LNJ5_9TRYP|nr:dynein heavy chain [Trypanosoma conorhini]RNF17851.1 dynein heavy chain [Trypanosoma conorhini]
MKALINLDNLEQCQNHWQLKTEAYHNEHIFIDPPKLNSPHSLRACALCGIVPTTALELPTLRQHVEDVMSGARWVDTNAPTQVTTQEALNACAEVGIDAGTTQQKIQAYKNYVRHVADRSEVLLQAQEIRRQLIAEEVFERRRRAHVEGNSVLCSSRCESGSPNAPEQGVLQASSQSNGNTVAAKMWTAHSGSDAAVTPMEQLEHAARGEARKLLERRVPGGSPCAAVLTDGTVAKGKSAEVAAGDGHPSKVAMTNRGVEARATPMREADAPPAPPIYPREQGEVFYYYCANATVAGRISECLERSVL